MLVTTQWPLKRAPHLTSPHLSGFVWNEGLKAHWSSVAALCPISWLLDFTRFSGKISYHSKWRCRYINSIPKYSKNKLKLLADDKYLCDDTTQLCKWHMMIFFLLCYSQTLFFTPESSSTLISTSQLICSWTKFSWMKSCVFLFKFHWSLFLKVQLTISQHWFR